MRRAGRFLSLFVAIFVIAGCSESVGKYGVKKIGLSKDIPIETVTAAMMRAIAKTEWKGSLVRPGLIEATRVWADGTYNIVVEINYSSKSYEIKHKSSKGLGYGGGSVHRSYNVQVGFLDKAIKDETWNL